MEQTLNDMKKDVLITVKGTQRVSGETDVTEMMTTGRFYRKNKLYYISYEETEATGSLDLAGHAPSWWWRPGCATSASTTPALAR